MNITDEQHELVAKIETLGAQLDTARADVALLRRLKAAETEEKRLAAELRAAQEALAEANAAAIQAQQDARFALFRDVKVIERVPLEGPALTHMQYEITVTRIQYDGRESVPTTQVFRDFRYLPDNTLDYLIEKHPDRVPASIRALDENDLWNAFDRYFVIKKRGMVYA
jgi:hypothetical protein